MIRRLTAAGLIVVALLGVGRYVAHRTFLAPRTTLPVTFTGTGSGTVGPFTPAGPWSIATTERFPGASGLTVDNLLFVQIVGTEVLVEPGQSPTGYDGGPYRLAVVTRPGASWSIRLFRSTSDVPAGRGWWVPILAVGAGFAMLYACHPVGLRRRRRPATPSRPALRQVTTLSAPVSDLLLTRPARPPRRRRHISWARALGDQGPSTPR